MDPENEDKTGENAAEEPKEGAANATEATDPTPDANEAASASEDGEELTDEHGHPAISKGKYERDIAAKDAKIADLEKQIGEAAKTEAGRTELEKKIDKLKGEIAEERTSHSLEMAGCRNVKAAKALLEDHGGDVSKLKEAEPWLFGKDKKEGSTGLKPDGAPKGGTAKSIRDALKQI